MNNYLAITGADLDVTSASTGLKWIAGQGIGPVIGGALPYIFGIAGFALVIFIVFSGYSLLTSKGDERAVAGAKAKLTYAVVGFIVIFASYWIVQIFGSILGLQKITNIFR